MKHRLWGAWHGLVFATLILGVEELSMLVFRQPALAVPDLLGVWLWSCVGFGVLGGLVGARTVFGTIVALTAVLGMVLLGTQIAQALSWRGITQGWATGIGGITAGGMALVGLWACQRFAARNQRAAWGLVWFALLLAPALQSINNNVLPAATSPEALQTDLVISLVVGIVAAILAIGAHHRPQQVLVGMALVLWSGTLGGRGLLAPTPATPAPSTDKPDLVVVVVDTLRADHLNIYGAKRPTSPQLETWAQDALVYESAQSAAPWTLPSFGTLLTGTYPHQHHAGINGGSKTTNQPLSPAIPTLAERLAEAGYRTGAIVSNPYLKAAFGLHRGFDTYDDALGFGHMPILVQPLKMLGFEPLGGREFYRQAPRMMSAAEAWWEQTAGGPRFLLLHLMDPHAPYNPPLEDRKAVGGGKSPGDLYAAEIHFVDRQLAPFLASLGDAFVVFTSDHGEAFGEHHDRYPQDPRPQTPHGWSLYQEQVHVPLVVKGPGVTPKRVDRSVPAVDIAATFIELAGAKPLLGPGEPLPEVWGRGGVDRPAGSQGINFGSEKRAVRLGDHKLIETRWGLERYDLAVDPTEQSSLDSWGEDLQPSLPVKAIGGGPPAVLDEQTSNALKAIGYL